MLGEVADYAACYFVICLFHLVTITSEKVLGKRKDRDRQTRLIN